MDESSWLECSDPAVMLDFVGEANGRQRRRFAAACCRRVWPMLGKGGRKAVVAAERFAAGQIGPTELTRASGRASRDSQVNRKWYSLQEDRTAAANHAAWYAAQESDESAEAARLVALAKAVREAEHGARRINRVYAREEDLHVQFRRRYGKADREDERLWERRLQERSEDAWGAERRTQADLLRCLFAPFRQVAAEPAFSTPLVASLAQAASDEVRLPEGELDPLRLAILADALEEGGCTDAGLLGHLRDRGPHVRGCWALEAIERPCGTGV